jgi:hypothetical protein
MAGAIINQQDHKVSQASALHVHTSRQIATNGGEIERRDSKDESFQRTVLNSALTENKKPNSDTTVHLLTSMTLQSSYQAAGHTAAQQT